ncbi:GNAT family N-acetyltransferase [Bradyrhizobium sp. LA6.12]|uniref:GNAT family N-acetyltransferase n=1 Tax=unclassified Bradyrhizobium TaxID=2631580 RepID=UPI0033985626
MSMQTCNPAPASEADLRHASSQGELQACYPVIAELRPFLRDAVDWCERATVMAQAGYRVLAAWKQDRAVAVAGYRVMENLIHGRFIYVDDLVTAFDNRGKGLGASLLKELAHIGTKEHCSRLVLDTAATNANARRFYTRAGLLDVAVGFVKQLENVT